MARNLDVERVAATHNMFRPVLVDALKQRSITSEGQAILPFNAGSLFELWERTFADKWFDMGTMIRLGTAIEMGLRSIYTDLASEPISRNTRVFQRLAVPTELEEVFRQQCGLEVGALPEWSTLREIMVHRHLYAHRSGLLDDKYIQDIATVTGSSIREAVESHGYPEVEVYWFQPLSRLDHFIGASRRYFEALT